MYCVSQATFTLTTVKQYKGLHWCWHFVYVPQTKLIGSNFVFFFFKQKFEYLLVFLVVSDTKNQF